MNRKAQVFDILPFIIGAGLFAIAIIIFRMFYTSLQGSGIPELEQGITFGLTFMSGLDLLVPCTVIGGMILTIFLVAPLRKIEGAWLVVLLIGLMVIYICAQFGNAFESILSDAGLAVQTPAFPLTTVVVMNLTKIAAVWVALLTLFSASKPGATDGEIIGYG